jgi:D-xylonolactonase
MIERSLMTYELQTLAHGYGLLEGPRYDESDGSLYFCDASEGGVYRCTADGNVETIVPRRKAVGGIHLHADGGIVISGRDISHVRDGSSRTVFKCTAPSINDIFVDRHGQLLIGTVRGEHVSRHNRDPGECILIGKDGATRELYGEIYLPNGIAFSPDYRVLYHADTGRNCIVVHDWSDSGEVSGRRTLAVEGELVPDGLAVDQAGTIWVADLSGTRAVRGFDPDGRELARIAIPALRPTSLSFGGRDGRDLYIVTADNTLVPEHRGTVFRTRVETPGMPVPRTVV